MVCRSTVQSQKFFLYKGGKFFLVEITLLIPQKLNYLLGYCNKIMLVVIISNHSVRPF